ncbi:hypothetical protein O181_022919 [Austropuccinia psidii MF-1]|uniref:Integrase catalytic domain-containing protein n=1 Tax=Austropuccinia psidii MF-1 TaxID=1389203 RepID=A0A9Q3GY63_9BASI|nr:hypothetical protein [Austropuccinia psidii MF-1]
MDTGLLLWNRFITHVELLNIIICDREPKFTSSPWTNIYRLVGTELSISTAYHPKTDGLVERMFQTLEDMIKRFCAYGLEFKDLQDFTYGWETLIPELELEHKKSVHCPTGQNLYMLEKGRNTRPVANTLRKYFI